MYRIGAYQRWVALIILGACLCPLRADDVQSGWDGQQIVPIDSKAIRMASEEVEVDVAWPKRDEDNGYTAIRVAAHFVLVNDSDQKQSILVSFPGAYEVHDFSRTVDGVPADLRKDLKGEYGNASAIDFAPRQTRHVRIAYEGSPTCTSGFYGESEWAYILKTGARWKGKIDKAVVTIRFPQHMPAHGRGPFSFKGVELSPANYQTDGRTATWVFEDFEPAEDVQVKWTGWTALMASDPFALKSKKHAAALLLEQGDAAGDLAESLKAFSAIREHFPKSREARTLDFHVAQAFYRASREGQLNKLYVGQAVQHFEKALKQPSTDEQRQDALCHQFVLSWIETGDRARAVSLFARLKEAELEEKAVEELMFFHWRDQPRRQIHAYEGVRTFFPQSRWGKVIDYYVATAYARHHADFCRVDELDYEKHVLNPTEAVRHYEAALKQPLDAAQRQAALGELYILYSVEVPDPAGAARCLELLGKETIAPPEWGSVLKVAAVSPQKALALMDRVLPRAADEKALIARERELLAKLVKTHPHGCALPPSAQTQPAPAETPQARR